MRAFVIYFLALGLFAQPEQTDAKRPIGVLFASKDWMMGSTAVKAGRYLPPTATLTTKGPAAELLLGCQKRGWLSYTCHRYPCSVPVCSLELVDAEVKRVDKAAGSDAPIEAGLGDKLMSWLSRPSPPPPITAGVRAGGNPNDAVVLAEAGNIHLAPALTRVLEGDYCFGLMPLGDPERHAPLTFRMKWDREEEPEGLVTLKGLTPGAYALEKEIADPAGACKPDADAVAAWIVVAPRDRFNGLTDQWKGNRAWLDGLSKSGVSAGAIATARHAIIAQLSDSIAH
jgi:hypothetical protein